MNNLYTVSNVNQYTKNLENPETRLLELVEWCKIVRACLDSQEVEDAKFFLEQAIATAEQKI